MIVLGRPDRKPVSGYPREAVVGIGTLAQGEAGDNNWRNTAMTGRPSRSSEECAFTASLGYGVVEL
jgi:hypothetical protein